MNKQQADEIIRVCKKYGITATINKIVDDYNITFMNRIEFNSFEAAKLMVNALVIEKRNKEKKNPVHLPPAPQEQKPLNFNRYNSPKRDQKDLGNWEKGGLGREITYSSRKLKFINS